MCFTSPALRLRQGRCIDCAAVSSHAPGSAGDTGIQEQRAVLSLLGCADGEHRFLADHVVDNRILMPAVSFVVTAWEAAAHAAGVPPTSFPVILEDIQVHQACVAQRGQKVTLGVQITADKHFYVSGILCAPSVACTMHSFIRCQQS